MLLSISFFFFFNDTATTEIYTLSLHDALPISPQAVESPDLRREQPLGEGARRGRAVGGERGARQDARDRIEREQRSEEHTSELQSPCNLVCRLLLEKKKRHSNVTVSESVCCDG